MPRSIAFLIVLCAAAACAGADGGGTAPAAPGAIRLTMAETDPMTSAGDQRSVSAEVRDASGRTIDAAGVTWSSSAATVATVGGPGARGVVTAVDDGAATITASIATPAGVLRASADVTVRRRLASLAFPAESVWVDMGTTLPLHVTGRDARGHPLGALDAMSFASRDSALAFVDEGGTVVTVQPRRANYMIVTARRHDVSVTDSLVIGVNVPLRFDFASLLMGDYEVPTRVPSPGLGLAYFIRDGPVVRYVLGWSALSGPVGAVHIHAPATATQTGDVLLDLKLVAQAGGYGLASGSFTAADLTAPAGRQAISLDSLLALMRRTAAYVDVHTVANPLGEVRGQIEGPFR